MREMIQLNFIGAVLLVIITLFLVFNPVMDKHKKTFFLVDVVIIFIMMVCNTQHYMFEGNPNHLWDLKLFSAVSYTLSGPVILPIIEITGTIKKRQWHILNGLATVNTILCIVSIFNGCIFFYDAGGNISFGRLILIPFIFAFVYLLVLLITSMRKYKLGFHVEAFLLDILACLVVIATYMNNVLNFKFLVSGMSVVSLLIYYMFFNIQVYTRDALTGALNRYTFYADIERLRKHIFYVVSTDLNGLKELNDGYGHTEGDRAIKSVAESAFLCLPPKARFYRMGGDEFAVLCPTENESEIRRFISTLKERVKESGYEVAAGYKLYKSSDDLEAVITAADEDMYTDKAAMKGSANIRR